MSNAKSDLLRTNCGVPQGSVLGPLLFLVHVNYISQNIKSSISLIADGTVLSYFSKCPTIFIAFCQAIWTLYNPRLTYGISVSKHLKRKCSPHLQMFLIQLSS